MSIHFSCRCGRRISAPETAVGRKGRCPACGQAMVVPARSEVAPATPAVPAAPAAPPPLPATPPALPTAAPPELPQAVPAARPMAATPASEPARGSPAWKAAPAVIPEGSRTDLASLRTSAESVLRTVSLVFTILIYLVLGVGTLGLGLIYIGFIMLGSYIMLAFMMAQVRGNGIRVGPDQLPQVYESAQRASRALGLPELPDVFIVQAGGVLNAFATRFAFRRYVVLYSDLVDACEGDPALLDMIMAHEIGHLALGHILWLWILLPSRLVPFLGTAYSRACEYSADRCGFAGCRSPAAAMRGLLILAAGGKQARMASLETFLRQQDEIRGFWQSFVELFSTHPWLTRRVAAIHEFAGAGSGA